MARQQGEARQAARRGGEAGRGEARRDVMQAGRGREAMQTKETMRGEMMARQQARRGERSKARQARRGEAGEARREDG